MDDNNKISEALFNRLFIEKVERLKKNRFVTFCLHTSSYTIRQQDPFNFPIIDGISRLSIDSFVLHFRFLIQPRDNISYKITYERLNKSGFISEKTKKLFEQCELYKNTEFKPTIGGKKYTTYELFEIIFYGGLAHHNPDKVNEFLNIASHIFMGGVAILIIANFVKTIFPVCKSLEADIKKFQKHEIPKV